MNTQTSRAGSIAAGVLLAVMALQILSALLVVLVLGDASPALCLYGAVPDAIAAGC